MVVETKRHIRVVSAAIVRDGKYLITQRTERAVLPGMWEFPGGKVEDGESDVAALQREIKHRLGVDVEVHEEISAVEREYRAYVVCLHLYRCDVGTAQPQPKSVAALAWASSEELERYDFTPADEESVHAVLFEDPEK